jgi:pilus assembly protein Flp/PilA
MLFAPKEHGQGLIEYAIILSLVAVLVVAVVRALGPKLGSTYSSINSSLP